MRKNEGRITDARLQQEAEKKEEQKKERKCVYVLNVF